MKPVVTVIKDISLLPLIGQDNSIINKTNLMNFFNVIAAIVYLQAFVILVKLYTWIETMPGKKINFDLTHVTS